MQNMTACRWRAIRR